MSIGPVHLAAAKAAVSLTGALTRAIGTAAEGMVAGAKPTFEQIFAGPSEPPAPDTAPPTIVQQITDRVRSLLSGAGIDLVAPASLAVSAEGKLVVGPGHPQKDLIETAIAHDKSIEHCIAQWNAANEQSGQREPMGFTIDPTFNRPGTF